MNLENYYYYFQSALSDRFVDDILAYGKEKEFQLAVTGNEREQGLSDKPLTDDQKQNLYKKRKSDVVWMNDEWIYREIRPIIAEANRAAGWNFQYDYHESFQFTRYEPGGHYDWHTDSWDKPYVRPQNEDGTFPPDHGKIRKLSMTISLSHPHEYEGGEFQVDMRNSYDYSFNNMNRGSSIMTVNEVRPRGSLVVFPSFVWHRVAPVYRGTRHSLVLWTLGNPFC